MSMLSHQYIAVSPDRGEHDRVNILAVFCVHIFQQLAAHARLPEMLQVACNTFQRFILFRHRLEKTADLVCHVYQIMYIHF